MPFIDILLFTSVNRLLGSTAFLPHIALINQNKSKYMLPNVYKFVHVLLHRLHKFFHTYLSITKLVIHTHITVMWHNYLYSIYTRLEAHIDLFIHLAIHAVSYCLGDNDCVSCAVVCVAADRDRLRDTQNLQISHTKLSVVL